MHPADVPGHLPEPIGERLAEQAAAVPADQAIVEVGSYLGRSTCYLASGAAQGHGAHVWAVDAWDLPRPEHGPGSGARERFGLPETRRAFLDHLQACGVAGRVTAIQAFSVDAAKDWDGPPVGLLFLDGDHSHAAVKADWQAWKPHLAEGAAVAFDDARRGRFGVNAFVTSLGLPVEGVHDDRLAIVRP